MEQGIQTQTILHGSVGHEGSNSLNTKRLTAVVDVDVVFENFCLPRRNRMSQKPHKGKIYHWCKEHFDKGDFEERYCEPAGLGYYIFGYKSNPPKLGNAFHTSIVIAHSSSGEIETRNSRYTLIGPENT